jgi:hypothetical protein
MVNDNRYKAHVIKFNFWNPELKKKKKYLKKNSLANKNSLPVFMTTPSG